MFIFEKSAELCEWQKLFLSSFVDVHSAIELYLE